MKRSFLKTSDLVLIGLFASLMAVASWITIPSVIPFTLQTFGVFVSVGLLGGKRGLLAILTFILIGFLGIPVFSGFKGGPGVIFGTTGGYIVGFIFSALIMWGFERLRNQDHVNHEKAWNSFLLILSMILGLIACYICGTLWFMLAYTRAKGAVSLVSVLSWCVFPFILPDIIKIILAFLITERLRSFVPR